MTSIITVGIIGVGRWGPNLLRNFASMEQVSVKTVCDIDPGRLKIIQQRFPSIAITHSPHDIFNDASIACVVICTPVSTHFALAEKALLSGKHAFVEKPLATSSDECMRLIDAAQRQGKVLFVGHTFKYNAGIRAAKKYIESGDLGDVYLIDANRTNLGPVRYDTNALWDLASHDISIFSYWLDGTPKAVSAHGGCYLNKNIEDVVYATFLYENGIIAHVHASWLNPRKIREITVVGTKKMLVWNDMNLLEPIRLYNRGIDKDEGYQDTFESFRLSIREGEVLIPSIKLNEPLLAECEHFIECVRTGARPLTDGEDGLMVVKALEAATRSLRHDSRLIPIL
ncbi:MAG: Gfo/Idh/MocA family oxidoreductase [Desulfobacterota bacterium]|nr:Gfo/Idh/MocA family oxidoreductase [Thermodesulfobacteriota bacterium]